MILYVVKPPIIFTLLQEHLKFSVQWREVYNTENENYLIL
jgi:hypothetical protein